MEKPELYKDLHQEEDAPEYDDGREEGCTEEYDEEICTGCANCDFEMVGHPGGSSVHSAKRHYCSIGFWEENF